MDLNLSISNAITSTTNHNKLGDFHLDVVFFIFIFIYLFIFLFFIFYFFFSNLGSNVQTIMHYVYS